jgi:hypothetical protein
MKEITFQVAINQKYRDKVKPGDGRFWDFNMTFRNSRLTLPKLLHIIRAGYAWTAPHRRLRRRRPTLTNPQYRTTYRVKENVISSQILALDSDTGDERSGFDALLADPFIGQYASLLHATASSTAQAPRTRIIFLLDAPLEPPVYEQALRGLLRRYPFCDQSVNHAAVVFYGAQACSYQLRKAMLPLSVLESEILQPYAAFLAAERQRREETRASRLAAYGSQEQAAPEQADRYVCAVYEGRLAELAATGAGLGLRHQRLYRAAVAIGSLSAAAWLPEATQRRLSGATQDLLLAATANGYAAAYGEEDALRTIENGLARGALLPWTEPVWYGERPFFEPGDMAQVEIDGEVKAAGRINRLRETTHWEYELDTRPNVWFARELLRQPAQN